MTEPPEEFAKHNAARMAAGNRRAAALIEDVEFMLTHRESLFMAAHRLEMTPHYLERYLGRQGRSDLVRALRSNQSDHVHNQYTKEMW